MRSKQVTYYKFSNFPIFIGMGNVLRRVELAEKTTVIDKKILVGGNRYSRDANNIMKPNKSLLFFCFMSLFANCFCQSYDTLATQYFKDKYGENINYIDSTGFRQGLWVDYIVSSFGHSDYGSIYEEFVTLSVMGFGHYIDDVKIGEWTYFDHYYKPWTEVYYKDKSVLELRYDGDLSNYYNCDSSIIISTVIDNTYSDTFCIKCVDKNKCILYSGNRPLDTFDYSPINLYFAQQDIFLSGYRRLKLKRLEEEN